MHPFPVIASTEINIDENKIHIHLTTFADIFDINIQSNYKQWFNDPQVTKYNSHGLFPYNPLLDNIKDFIADKSRIVWSLVSEDKSYFHIGNVSLQSINMINRSAEIACVIGESFYWNKGLMTWACEKIIEHGFLNLGLNRIWSGTSILNIGMQKVFYKLKFRDEGCFREGQYLNGGFQDVICYGLLRKEWEEREKAKGDISFPCGNEINSVPSQEEEIKSEGLIKRMEEIRSNNNSNWMGLVRLAFENNAEKAKDIMKSIDNCDKQIGKITKQLSE